MKTELLRMLSPDALDMGKVGGGWAALRPEDVAAALAGLAPGPYYLAMTIYVYDSIAYEHLASVVAGLRSAPKRPEAMRRVSRKCKHCEGQRVRIYTNLERTIPITMRAQKQMVAFLKAKDEGFELRGGEMLKPWGGVYLTGLCRHCSGNGVLPLDPVGSILDLCLDELWGNNKCGTCEGAGVDENQRTCDVCKGRKFKVYTPLTRAMQAGIPYEFWLNYKGFYDRLFNQLTDWDAQIRTHIAKRFGE